MTNRGWLEGWSIMRAVLGDKDLDPRIEDIRAAQYRESLDDLSDGAFLYAAKQARDRLDWLPSPRKIRKLAEPEMERERMAEQQAKYDALARRHREFMESKGVILLPPAGTVEPWMPLPKEEITRDAAVSMLRGTKFDRRND